jgi:RIO-like serine/threonine protein kinase
VSAPRLDPTEARVLVAISLYRREHGEGPPWKLIAKAAGWSEDELGERLRRLRKARLVWFTTERGSIRVKSRGLEQALAQLRRQR